MILSRLAAAYLVRLGPRPDFFENLAQYAAPGSETNRLRHEPSETGLVETGSFRVDAARALSALSRFQLADPADFLLPWLRAAVRCRANLIDLDYTARGLELRFDGDPLPERLLLDPFAGLFSEDGQDRERDLAYGLLAAARLRPARVAWVSGSRKRRRWLALGGEVRRDESDRTVLSVEWNGPLGRLAARRCLARAEAAFGLAGKAKLSVNGRRAAPPPADSRSFILPAGSGLMVPAWRGRLAVYVHGVLAGETDLPGAKALVMARLDDARLDASLALAGGDAELAAFKRTVTEMAGRVLPRVGPPAELGPYPIASRLAGAALVLSGALISVLGAWVLVHAHLPAASEIVERSGRVTSWEFEKTGDDNDVTALVFSVSGRPQRMRLDPGRLQASPGLEELSPAQARDKLVSYHALREEDESGPGYTLEPLSLSLEGKEYLSLEEGRNRALASRIHGGVAGIMMGLLIAAPGLVVLLRIRNL